MTEATSNENDALDRVSATLTDAVSRLCDVSVGRVFHDPVSSGERVVITAATLQSFGGFGFGGGPSGTSSGAGGGGGGGSEGRPVAAIELSPEGVRVRPVVDLTRIGLTLVIGLLAVWRTGRRARHRKAHAR